MLYLRQSATNIGAQALLRLIYRDEAFGAELARGGMPPVRIVPESGTIRDDREVLVAALKASREGH